MVEGADGVGKTTQTARLARFLEGRGLPVLATREPGGTPVGEAIRGLVLNGRREEMPAATELLLILAARSAFAREVVGPALAEGKWVLSERYDLSTLAYQGWGRGIGLDRIERLNRYAAARLVPHLYLVLDLPEAEGMARRRRSGREPDRIEAEGRDFHRRVREGYLALAEGVPQAVRVDAAGTPAEVEDRMIREVERRFPEAAR